MKQISGLLCCLVMFGMVVSSSPVMAQAGAKKTASPVAQVLVRQPASLAVPREPADPLMSFKKWEAPAVADDSFYSLYIEQQLEIGTRMTHFVLLKNHRGEPFNGSFVGSLTRLKENQDYVPVKLFVQYKFLPCLGVGLSYDKLSAAAWDDQGTDGDCVISGPLLYLLGSYPNTTDFTPFCELGLAFYSAEFNHSSGWGNVPGKAFLMDNTTGFYLGAGCDWKVADNISLDLYGRYMNADVKGTYTDPGQDDEAIIFTMSSLTFGLGAKYTF